jgi:leucyl-tRNA synthetase
MYRKFVTAVLHLYYARFLNHFLHSVGLVPYREPFQRLLIQGMVMGQSYRFKGTGRYLPKENVDLSGEL